MKNKTKMKSRCKISYQTTGNGHNCGSEKGKKKSVNVNTYISMCRSAIVRLISSMSITITKDCLHLKSIVIINMYLH